MQFNISHPITQKEIDAQWKTVKRLKKKVRKETWQVHWTLSKWITVLSLPLIGLAIWITNASAINTTSEIIVKTIGIDLMAMILSGFILGSIAIDGNKNKPYSQKGTSIFGKKYVYHPLNTDTLKPIHPANAPELLAKAQESSAVERYIQAVNGQKRDLIQCELEGLMKFDEKIDTTQSDDTITLASLIDDTEVVA